MKATAEATDDELVNSTLSRLDRHFSEGVTTCEIKSGYGSTIENELRLLRIINKIKKIHHSDVIPTCLAAHVKPMDFESNEVYLDSIIDDVIPLLRKENLSNRIDIFTEEKAFSVDESTRYLSLLHI